MDKVKAIIAIFFFGMAFLAHAENDAPAIYGVTDHLGGSLYAEQWQLILPEVVVKNYVGNMARETVTTREDGRSVAVRNYRAGTLEYHLLQKPANLLKYGEQTSGTVQVVGLGENVTLADGLIIVSADEKDSKKVLTYQFFLSQPLEENGKKILVPIRMNIVRTYTDSLDLPERVEKKIFVKGVLQEHQTYERITLKK